MNTRTLRAPAWPLLMLEARAPWEYAALLAAQPWLNRLPSGDGHPVLVLPGLGASDTSTGPLRRFLRQRGYSPYAWRQGFNLGPRAGVLEACHDLLNVLEQRHGEPVSLVGWSLGGLYARELAKERPQTTRCVITLGSPFAGHPRATRALSFFRLVSGGLPEPDDARVAQLRQPPPVPTTSIYSRTDGIVAWPCSVNPAGAQVENIEVQASHLGLGMNPAALYAVADRLAQPSGAWQPFAPRGLARWLCRVAPVAA